MFTKRGLQHEYALRINKYIPKMLIDNDMKDILMSHIGISMHHQSRGTKVSTSFEQNGVEIENKNLRRGNNHNEDFKFSYTYIIHIYRFHAAVDT